MAENIWSGTDASRVTKVTDVHLKLLQYPILSKRIRERMREQLFAKGIKCQDILEDEVIEKAVESQRREHQIYVSGREAEEIWQERLEKIRDILTEFYFAYNFTPAEFDKIITDVLNQQQTSVPDDLVCSINPEIAPWDMLFSEAEKFESFPEEKKHQVSHYLREIIVVLTKGMLSDHLVFVGIAKNVLSIKDLDAIYKHRIGKGKVGGKAGGLMLAKSILYTAERDDPVNFRDQVIIPDSYFIGSDVFYEFLSDNQLSDAVHQKYKSPEIIKSEYPEMVERFLRGKIPENYRHQLYNVLKEIGYNPLIVRSSSLLEDNFGIAFAGKYESYFCPNQGSYEQNLTDLCNAIKRVYASVLSPDALAYRQQKGLIDYDERMAILIQKVQGQRFGDYFFPVVAGVGFSFNPFQWSPRIDRQAGFLRIVTGLGTRAVERSADDYAKMIALSHPSLQPVKSNEELIHYSQQYLDVINLKENRMETLPIRHVIDWHFPFLRAIGSLEYQNDIYPLTISGPGTLDGNILVTFDSLLKNKSFIALMKAMLKKLARHYNRPVDIEFTVELVPGSTNEFRIRLLQCRQQSRRAEEGDCSIPSDIPGDDILFLSRRMVSPGKIECIRYVIYIDPEKYNTISDGSIPLKLARTIGQLNALMKNETFILVGPGRWGSCNMTLGVPVSYADIYNTRALVEVAVARGEVAPEASYGTHFFQDLVESDIYPLPLYPDEAGAYFNYQFFRGQSNKLAVFLPDLDTISDYLSVIDLDDIAEGKTLEIIMNAGEEKAIGYLK